MANDLLCSPQFPNPTLSTLDPPILGCLLSALYSLVLSIQKRPESIIKCRNIKCPVFTNTCAILRQCCRKSKRSKSSFTKSACKTRIGLLLTFKREDCFPFFLGISWNQSWPQINPSWHLVLRLWVTPKGFMKRKARGEYYSGSLCYEGRGGESLGSCQGWFLHAVSMAKALLVCGEGKRKNFPSCLGRQPRLGAISLSPNTTSKVYYKWTDPFLCRGNEGVNGGTQALLAALIKSYTLLSAW